MPRDYTTIVGQTFGYLFIKDEYYLPEGGRKKCLCRCKCGKIIEKDKRLIKKGNVKSCGCLQKEKPNNLKHGHNRRGKTTKEYRTWANMLDRCYNPKNNRYADWGGRGIRVCVEWRADFEEFLKDMGPCPGKGYSIERIDNDGDYCPENCRWATDEEQRRNKSSNIWLEYNGKRMIKQDWARELNINPKTLESRLNLYHWSTIKALSTPVRKGNCINKNNDQ